MHHIPPLPSVYLSADDYKANAELSTIDTELSYDARASYLGHCAETLQRLFESDEFKTLSSEHQLLHKCVLCVLVNEDDVSDVLAEEYIYDVVRAVLGQHLFDHDADPQDSDTIIDYLDTTFVDAPNGTKQSLFESLVADGIGMEYSASIFMIVSNIIDIMNARAGSHAKALH